MSQDLSTQTLPTDPALIGSVLAPKIQALIAGERDWVANLANAAAHIAARISGLNWAGFYLWRQSEKSLVLGPFFGRPACVRIALGRGVCGTAVQRRRSVVVPDVHAFPGHIACDSASASELVVPLLAGKRLLGVFDLDSPHLGRFGEQEQIGFEILAKILVDGSDWPVDLGLDEGTTLSS